MRLRVLPFALLAFASFAFVGPATAQAPPPAAEPSEIIVQGHRYRDQDVRDFIDALTPARVGGQLSKFDWAVCPAAVGLSEHHLRAITARMRQVAAAAGIKVAQANCRPNALVIVARDKTELIKALRRKHPGYFTDPLGDRIVPDRQPGPVAAWHVESRVDSNGVAAAVNSQSDFYVVESTDSSRLVPASRPVFAVGVLVVELKALAGLTSTQLADYAAMRLFARTDPARLKNGAAPTILHAIDAPMGSAVPITLTHWDLGFLRALYSARPNQFAHGQRGDMERSLRQELRNRQDRSER